MKNFMLLFSIGAFFVSCQTFRGSENAGGQASPLNGSDHYPYTVVQQQRELNASVEETKNTVPSQSLQKHEPMIKKVLKSGSEHRQGEGDSALPVNKEFSEPTKEMILSKYSVITPGLLESIDEEREEDSEELAEGHVKYLSPYGQVRTPYNKEVEKWIHYFQNKGQDRMKLYLGRSARYIPVMKSVLRDYNLPEDLVYVAMIESGFSPVATSFANAVGYWQFIAETGRRYGLRINSYVDERRDPVLSTRAAAKYLKDLYNAFHSWHLALASYNAGPYRVSRSILTHYTRDFWYLISRRSLPRETSNYVPKFIAAYFIGKNPGHYGFSGIEYQDPLTYKTIPLEHSISLKKLAKNMGMEYTELKRLNPSFRGEYVPFNDKAFLRVPLSHSVDSTALALCKMKKPGVIHSDTYWYRVRRGDTLYRLARRNKTTVSTIRRLNKMRRRSILRAGNRIRLPYSHRIKRQVASLQLDKKESHQVRRGENLFAIARRYGVSMTDLKQINALRSEVIHPGQVLKLKSSNSPGKEKYHIVKKGDTLLKIARRYNTSLLRLMKKNSLNMNSIIAIGSKIVIP